MPLAIHLLNDALRNTLTLSLLQFRPVFVVRVLMSCPLTDALADYPRVCAIFPLYADCVQGPTNAILRQVKRHQEYRLDEDCKDTQRELSMRKTR